MKYKNLPPVGSVVLPELEWVPTPCFSSRRGRKVEDIWLHRWGITDWKHERIQGVINTFRNPSAQASAHFVYAGEIGPDKGRCIQMIALQDKAWTEGNFNAEGISIECADAIWLGYDPEGFARLARIVGWLLVQEKFPAQWVMDPHSAKTGITRHADGGSDAGGHTACPTTDLELWRQFIARVKAEVEFGNYRKKYAR